LLLDEARAAEIYGASAGRMGGGTSISAVVNGKDAPLRAEDGVVEPQSSYIERLNSNGRTIWIADAYRGDGKRFIVRAEEKLTAFLELESASRAK
jgi:hypothetical protein